MRRVPETIPALLIILAAACTGAPPPSSTPSAELRPAEAGGAGSPSFLITGARVLDGTGAPARAVDVRVRGSRIAQVGELTPGADETVIDAEGLALAPGFIDSHSHHDRGLLDMPDARGAVSQGITTIVVGQDGGSRYPIFDFFAAVDSAGVAVNVASYTGHGTLRRRVMGEDFARVASSAEIDSMRALLRRDLEAGSLGLSTGLEYDPGIYATTEEVISLAREAGWAGGRYISHLRSEDRELWEAVEEIIRIGREADIPVQIGHMKLAMKSMWGRADELIARLDRARASGVAITADVYPYTYWQSTMTVLFPDRQFDDREAAEFALREVVPPEGMLLARYEAEPAYEGRTLAEVAAERGEAPAVAYMELIRMALEADAEESIIATSMAEEDVARLLQWERTNVSSDGALDGSHPRGYGAFTRFLGRYVRGGPLSLPEAVRKMTALSAAHVGIEERGVIRPGAYADLVLFDPATVIDRATPQDPHATSEGIHRVWVNGVTVYQNGSTTGARPGRVVRRGTSPAQSAEVEAPWWADDRASTEPVDTIFQRFWTRDAPGCALGVFTDGETLYERGYGMADLESYDAITGRSVFRTGSVGKQFTAAAIVLAAQDGFLELDDPVRDYIPEIPDFGPDFTIRSLLHHTSGVRDYLTLMSLAGYRDMDWYSNQDVLDALARQRAPNFPPGSDFLYSNAGYFLLSQIVRRATGRTLAEYAEDRLFAPLGMTSTHFHDDPTRVVPRRAAGYAPREGGGYRISMTTLPMVGDGGVFTSIEDLRKWDHNLDDGATVGGPDFVATMHRRGVLNSGDTIDYALGLRHDHHNGLRTVGHGGSFVGFRAATLRYPEEQTSVYVLCNRSDVNPSDLARRVGAVVLADAMAPASPADAGTDTDAGTEEAAAVDTVEVAADRLEPYAGVYYSPELDHEYLITLEDGELMLHVGNYLDGPLAPLAGPEIGPDTFDRGWLRLRFQRERDRVTGFALDAGRVRGIVFERE